ncbi:MAG: GNAT family N-acetyltransferase [Candidatus Hodarchaeales archaeon]|jgi:RimJ/RimL family protein N-acetyltransferase
MKLLKIKNYHWEGNDADSNKFSLRLRRPEDREHFRDFLDSMPLEAAYPKGIVLSESDIKPGEFRLTRNHFIVEKNGKIIGALSFHPGNEHDYHFRHGIRVHLNILPSYGKQGYGSTLLDVFEEYAKLEMFYRISTGTLASNTAAINLFLKKGYQIEGRTKRAIKLRFKDKKEEIKGKSEIFVDAILLGKWIGPEIIDYQNQFGSS